MPFVAESVLSLGVGPLKDGERLWYRRTFTVPAGWQGRRVLLHLGAVDWEVLALINGKEVGSHQGGYGAFSFDITAALRPTGEQELVLEVTDPSDAGTQPRGKQVRVPHGTWYGTASAIWQTVWLEPVEANADESLKLIPETAVGALDATVQARGEKINVIAPAVALDGGKEVRRTY